MPPRPKHLKKKRYVGRFPRISKKNHEITSDPDPYYNCIAFAVDITNRKYWPLASPDYYWPDEVPNLEKLDAFVRLFETFGYARVADVTDDRFVEGMEKVAIFATENGTPKHAAKLIGPDLWTSKLGDDYDIEHERDAVSGGDYGKIAVYMQRKKNTP